MYNSVSRIVLFDNALTPKAKYAYVLNNSPQLIQEFPLKMIASYLKITPETLSRSERRLSGDKVSLDRNQVQLRISFNTLFTLINTNQIYGIRYNFNSAICWLEEF